MAIMIFYKDMKAMVSSPDSDTLITLTLLLEFCKDISLAQFLFIFCLDYVLQTSVDLMKENSFTLKKSKKQTSCGNY